MPSCVAALGDDQPLLCGYLSGVAEQVVHTSGEVTQQTEVLAAPRRFPVVVLDGGRLAVAVQDEVRLLAPSG